MGTSQLKPVQNVSATLGAAMADGNKYTSAFDFLDSGR
jgi:hypothetical protein